MITQTERLRIRRLALEDAEFVLGLVSEPSFVSNIGDKGVRSLDTARRFILDGPWANQGKPGLGQFLVELATTGEPIGVCGLLYRERLDVVDVGFALLSAYRGHGYAYEAAAAVVEYGRSELGLGRIVALTSEDNLPSIRVLERLGMRFERVVKMSEDDPGTALYSWLSLSTG